MDFAYIEQLFKEYGYWFLFGGLFMEFIAIPFPGETALTYAGYLAHLDIIHWFPSILLSFTGTTMGMTITYLLGYKAGAPFIERYGKWALLSPGKLHKTKRWFDKYGGKVLLIGYFIPGVRHFTGYLSGIVQIRFCTFALYAYAGAFIWVVLFVAVGYILGPQWQTMFELMSRYGWKLINIAGLGLLLYSAFKLGFRYLGKNKSKERQSTDKTEAAASNEKL